MKVVLGAGWLWRQNYSVWNARVYQSGFVQSRFSGKKAGAKLNPGHIAKSDPQAYKERKTEIKVLLSLGKDINFHPK
jgi:hypothetical protein